MSTISVTLPDELNRFVEEQASRAGHSSPSDYVARLVEEEQRRQAKAMLEAQLLAGLDSGPPSEMTKHDWQELRDEVLRRAAARGQGR